MQFTYEREFTYNRAYRGPIKMVVLDWAGTTMDFGCMAPAVVFCKSLKRKEYRFLWKKHVFQWARTKRYTLG